MLSKIPRSSLLKISSRLLITGSSLTASTTGSVSLLLSLIAFLDPSSSLLLMLLSESVGWSDRVDAVVWADSKPCLSKASSSCEFAWLVCMVAKRRALIFSLMSLALLLGRRPCLSIKLFMSLNCCVKTLLFAELLVIGFTSSNSPVLSLEKISSSVLYSRLW